MCPGTIQYVMARGLSQLGHTYLIVWFTYTGTENIDLVSQKFKKEENKMKKNSFKLCMSKTDWCINIWFSPLKSSLLWLGKYFSYIKLLIITSADQTWVNQGLYMVFAPLYSLLVACWLYKGGIVSLYVLWY